MSDAIIVITRMRAGAGEAEAVKQLATSLASQTRKEPGALRYDLYQNTQDETYFILHEVWKEQNAINEHMATAHFKTFMAKSAEVLVQPGAGIEGPFEVTIATPFDPSNPPDEPQVTIATRMKAQPGSVKSTEQTATTLATATHSEPGCISYDLFQHIEEPSYFILFEKWRGFGAIQQHMGTAHFATFMEKAAGLLTQPAENVEGMFEIMICTPFGAS